MRWWLLVFLLGMAALLAYMAMVSAGIIEINRPPGH